MKAAPFSRQSATFRSPFLGNAPIFQGVTTLPSAIAMVSRRKGGGGRAVVVGNGTVADLPAPGYEQLRDQRVRENLDRMQKLGIIELSLKLKSTPAAAPKRFPKNFSQKEPPTRSPADEPFRRSSRYCLFFSSLVHILCFESFVVSMVLCVE